MSKSSIVCPSCNTDNEVDAEFCTNCGTTLNGVDAASKTSESISSREQRLESYREWLRSVPFILAACIFLLAIDQLTSPGITWAYWPVVPLILFALIAPYFSYKLELRTYD